MTQIDLGSRDGRKLASTLCHWSTFVETIDDEVSDWLTRLAPYAEENYNGYDLLENLARLSKDQAPEAQQIWGAMLVRSSVDHPEKAIRELFRNRLYKGPEGSRLASEIVDKYLHHGVDRPLEWFEEEQATYQASVGKNL